MPYKLTRKKISLSVALIGVVITLVFGFVFGNMRDLLLGSPLSVKTASNGATLTDGFLPISGNARHARIVLINGRSVAIDREGNFVDGVILSPGYNVVEIALKDQFGKEKVKTYHLVLDETSAVAQVKKKGHAY